MDDYKPNFVMVEDIDEGKAISKLLNIVKDIDSAIVKGNKNE